MADGIGKSLAELHLNLAAGCHLLNEETGHSTDHLVRKQLRWHVHHVSVLNMACDFLS